MRRICILTSVHSPFDVRIYYREAISLKRAGYDVTIVAPWKEKLVTVENISIEALPTASNRTKRFLLTGWRVYRAALLQKADLYHFHDPELIPWMVLLASRGCKIVYDVHEYFAESILTKQWIPSFIRSFLATMLNDVEKQASRRFSGIITVNPHMEQLFHPYNNLVETVPNFPLPWFIERFNKGNSYRTGLIAYVGSMEKARGYELIIKTMESLNETDGNANLLIIGPIDYDGIDDRYPRLEQGRNYQNICWAGVIPFEDVPSILAQAQICWIPWQNTPNNERGTPIKLFEYMAAGRPVVVSDLSFISQIVRENECGLVVDPNDPNAHADAVRYLMTHPEEGKEMGIRGQKAVQEKYNWERQEKSLLGLYQKILPGGDFS